MTDMIVEVFETIQTTLENFFDVLNTGITSVVDLFYEVPKEGVTGGFTFLGTVLMIGLGVGLVWTLIKWISGLVKNVAR